MLQAADSLRIHRRFDEATGGRPDVVLAVQCVDRPVRRTATTQHRRPARRQVDACQGAAHMAGVSESMPLLVKGLHGPTRILHGADCSLAHAEGKRADTGDVQHIDAIEDRTGDRGRSARSVTVFDRGHPFAHPAREYRQRAGQAQRCRHAA
ncbi:MAG: hypothetical protein ABW207_14260 [Stenotrophomonas chelatiphaga]